ncbi:unnamed protein product [Durusdinium trenchii]|uniref:Dolichol kinase n=1 Tax=Durusdinium trenchii TaxID=1381693 RepID=A0ABP0I2J7_9DINO
MGGVHVAGTAEGGGVDAPKSQIAPETNPHWKACLVYLSGALVLLGIGLLRGSLGGVSSEELLPRYGGHNMAPGPKIFVRHLTRCFGQQLWLTVSEAIRFVVLGTLLVHFCRRPHLPSKGPNGGRESEEERRWTKLAGVLLCFFLLHTLLVLLVSLPPNRPLPQRVVVRAFFTADTWRLARHVAELLASVLLLGGRCFYGDLPLLCFLPVGLVALLPVVQLLLWYRPRDCCREAALMLGCLMSAPLLLAIELGQLAWQCRWRFFNVRDGPLHLLIALIACPLALLRTSLTPALVLFAAHSALISLCLVARGFQHWYPTCVACVTERCCCLARGICHVGGFRRLARREPRAELVPAHRGTWRPGNTWFFAVLVALEAFSLAVEQKWVTLLLLLLALRALQRAALEPPPPMPRNGIGSLLLQGPMWWCSLLVAGEASGLLLRELGPPRDFPSARSVAVASVAWLLLLASLACSVNWSRCCSGYRRWQQRNSTFVLALTAPDP